MADTQFEVEVDFRNNKYQSAEKGLKALAAHLNQSWDGAAKVLSKELRDFLDTVALALAKRHSGAWPGGTSAMTLSTRSGALMASIRDSVRVTGTNIDGIEGFIGSPLRYARIQETGGTVKAKNAKYLTIPLPAALNGNGTPIKSKARDWPNTFVARSKAGNLLIFQRRGTNIVPLYVLKSEVYIPPRLGMRKTLDIGIPTFVERAMDQMVKQLQKDAT